jgi:hypothetical protein
MGATYNIERPTNTNAINQERNHMDINLSVKPMFTETSTKVTKKVVTKLIIIANFMSLLLGLSVTIFFIICLLCR